MESFKNIYEVRKSIRFELKPYNVTREILKGDNDYWNLDSKIKHIKKWEFEENFNWNRFCLNGYSNFLEKSKSFLTFLEEVNLEIKKENWIKWKKDIYFDFKRLKWVFKNIPSLKKIEKFDNNFKDKLYEIEKEYKILFHIFQKLENKEKWEANEKKSEISKYLRKISYLNRNFLTIFKFFDEYKTDKYLFDNYKKLLDETFEKINNSIIASNENEKTGSCFWKFTFNKYSLFRRETENLKDKYYKNKKLLEENVKNIVETKKIKDDREKIIEIKLETILDLKLEKENEKIQERLEKFNFERNLDEVISELDYINWNILNNYIQNFIKDYKENKQTLIFKNESSNKYNKWKIILNNNEYNISALRWQTLEWWEYLTLLKKDYKDLNKDEKEEKRLVDKFLNIILKNKNINKDFDTIKNFRDKLAKYRWKLRQNFSASEREFINEAMIKYYAKILEKDWNYFLALTDKNNILDKNINNIKIDKNIKWNIFSNTFNIYNYSHLHFWALEKLCLMWDWDLIKNDWLIKQWNKYKNQKNNINWRCAIHQRYFDKKCENCKNDKEKKEKEFFSSFQSHIIKSLYKLKENNWEDWTQYITEIEKLETIEEIVKFINSNFYKLEKKEIKTEEIFELAEENEVELFQIYSKDFNIFNEKFLSWEENLRILKSWEWYREDKKEHWEETKLISNTKRKKDKKKNLFTIYFEEVFKNRDTFLWQEWWVFFRNANLESDKKRFRNNKFFVSFDIKFNKWTQNDNIKLCEKKEKILEEHIKNINYITISKLKNIKDENKIFIWLDRWEKEHISYGIYDWKLKFQWKIWHTNYVKKIWKEQEKFQILEQKDYENITLKIGNKIIKIEKPIYKQLTTTHKYFDENWKEEINLLELNWLQEYHILYIFKQWENWEYFVDLENWWKFILNSKKYWFTILDRNWEEIKIIDWNDWKEIIDYYLLFESEKFKRILEINDEIKYSENMFNLKKWYISIIKDFFDKIIFDYKKEWKEVIFIFENQTSNKKDISNKYLWSTILSDIEENIITKFNYLINKESNDKFQLTPKIKKEDILFKNNNIYEMFWNCIFINQDNTSTWCPNCKKIFLNKWKKWKIEEIPWNTLFWHWTGNNEWNMKHLTYEEYDNLYEKDEKFKKNHTNKNWKKIQNKYLALNNCKFYLQNQNFSEFNFIKSWDNLATYNIAKKWLEYINSLN